jgi:hypothetical protein
MAQTDKPKQEAQPQVDLQAEIDRLKAENAELRLTLPKGQGMTVPKDIKVSTIIHQNDPKTKEPISPTVRRDHGFDPSQRFQGRQP